MSFIRGHRERWGVEPICRVLQVAPSTCYAAVCRRPSVRRRDDERLKPEIARVHRANFGVYGAEKVWRQLNREGVRIGRDRVARLMGELQLVGAVRGKRKRTTLPAEVGSRPTDLVERHFTAVAPNRLWVADLTYVSTWSGFVYTALIIDAFSRSIVGWRVSSSLHAELALDALEMALWQRRPGPGLIHHADRGVQYLAIRYTERLAEAGAVCSVGSRGDSFDNALAENFFATLKVERIYRTTYRTREDAELDLVRWIDGWYNPRRIQAGLGGLSPDEYEDAYHRAQRDPHR